METGCFSKKSSNQDLLLLHFMDNNFFSVLWIVFTWSLFTIENRWWWTPDIYLEENRKAISWPSRTLRTILLKPQKIFFMKALLRNIHSISWGLFLKLLSPPLLLWENINQLSKIDHLVSAFNFLKYLSVRVNLLLVHF